MTPSANASSSRGEGFDDTPGNVCGAEGQVRKRGIVVEDYQLTLNRLIVFDEEVRQLVSHAVQRLSARVRSRFPYANTTPGCVRIVLRIRKKKCRKEEENGVVKKEERRRQGGVGRGHIYTKAYHGYERGLWFRLAWPVAGSFNHLRLALRRLAAFFWTCSSTSDVAALVGCASSMMRIPLTAHLPCCRSTGT